MIVYNGKEYDSFKELHEKCNLISEREVCMTCGCWWETVRKICEQYKIAKYPVIANGKNCFVYDVSIINLIRKIRPKKKEPIPEDYITRKDLATILGIKLCTLSELEFWCWDFKKYKKSFSGVVCYQFTEEARNFYNRKLYKWYHPDRLHGTCWQK